MSRRIEKKYTQLYTQNYLVETPPPNFRANSRSSSLLPLLPVSTSYENPCADYYSAYTYPYRSSTGQTPCLPPLLSNRTQSRRSGMLNPENRALRHPRNMQEDWSSWELTRLHGVRRSIPRFWISTPWLLIKGSGGPRWGEGSIC
jgi:hypothetical protein